MNEEFDLRLALFNKRIPFYRNDIILFAREVLLFEPDECQAKILRSVVVSRRVSVKSGQGVGKTSVEAVVLLWFLSCYPYTRIVATAPTRQQLHDVLWAEVAKWQARSPLLCEILKWTKSYIYMKGYEKQWFAVAKTATRPENMQGFHADNMLFIVDEASGVADDILEAIMGTLSSENNKLLLCGNPTRNSGIFFDSHTRDRDIYNCFTISSLESSRTDKDNIGALLRKFGRDSNVFRVRVLGEFPLQEDDVFIPLPLLENSVKAAKEQGETCTVNSIHIGCDVARFGDDKTVIGYKADKNVVIYKKSQGQDLMRTADEIILLARRLIDKYNYSGKIPVKIDDGGVGGGVVDRLNRIKKENAEEYKWLQVMPIKFGVRIRHKYYYDSTTLMMANLKDMLSETDEGGTAKEVEVFLPDDAELLSQLSSRKYEMTADSKIRIESKDEMKKRGFSSPDEGDFLLLVCWKA